MRLYLSSFRIGDHPERLLPLIRPNARVAVIANSVDMGDQARRAAGVEYEIGELHKLGLGATELDLREYFGRGDDLATELLRYDLLWVRGGNTFMLRHALAQSGADALIKDLLARDVIAYRGYSAGVCVLTPSLRGLEVVDDPGAVQTTYGVPARWDALGVLSYWFVPHYRSPGHPETERCERLAEHYEASGLPHKRLRDGQTIVIDGDREEIV